MGIIFNYYAFENKRFKKVISSIVTGISKTLDSTLDSLRVYLQRRKDLGYSRTHYKLLYQFFRQLIQLKPGDKQARKELRESITEADAFG